MKVDKKIGGMLQNVDQAKAGKLSSKATDKNISLNKADVLNSAKVDVSNRAQMMQKAKEIASKETIDEAKVARLQKLIDEGKYKTDAAAISHRLVDAHMDFPE